MKKLILLALLLALSGCGILDIFPRPFNIYNGCLGSWVTVKDARGNILVGRLEYGAPAVTVDIGGVPQGTVELTASGFDLEDNFPLGSATERVYIPQGGTLAKQLPTWEIVQLRTTDRDGGCRHH